MKKIILFFIAASICISSSAAFISDKIHPKASEIFIRLEMGKSISMQQLAHNNAAGLEKLINRKNEAFR